MLRGHLHFLVTYTSKLLKYRLKDFTIWYWFSSIITYTSKLLKYRLKDQCCVWNRCDWKLTQVNYLNIDWKYTKPYNIIITPQLTQVNYLNIDWKQVQVLQLAMQVTYTSKLLKYRLKVSIIYNLYIYILSYTSKLLKYRLKVVSKNNIIIF